MKKSISIGLIPARSGSKRVKNKNIKKLGNDPLISFTIRAALEAETLDAVICSTDSKEIAEIAEHFGAQVPFIRPMSISDDKTNDGEVIFHAITEISQQWSVNVDSVVYLRPTTPFKTGKMIDCALLKVKQNPDATGLRSISKVHGVNHPYWMFKLEENRLSSFCENIDLNDYYQSQMLPDCYRLNGVVDILNNTENRNFRSPFGNHPVYLEIPEIMSLDIDTEIDFNYGEFIISNQSDLLKQEAKKYDF